MAPALTAGPLPLKVVGHLAAADKTADLGPARGFGRSESKELMHRTRRRANAAPVDLTPAMEAMGTVASGGGPRLRKGPGRGPQISGAQPATPSSLV